MNIAKATPEDIEAQAKDIATIAGMDWDKLSDEEKHQYRTEASFTFGWLCE